MNHRPFRLKPTLNFYQHRKRFWVGLICGVGIAVVVFYFQLLLLQANVYMAREAFNALIQISSPQLHWYVGFFASVGFLAGSSITFLIWLAQFRKKAKNSRRPWLYMARNDQANVLPSFFHIYVKLVFVIFLWFLSFKWLDASNTELPDIVKVFAVLLPIVLLLNQWVNMRRYFRVKVYWIGAHLLLLCAVSLSGLLVPLPLEGYLRQLFEEKRPFINLNIQYPDVVCDDFIRDYFRNEEKHGDLYLGFLDGDSSKPIRSVPFELTNGVYPHGKVVRNVHIDKRLPMSAVDSFILNYRKNELVRFNNNWVLILTHCDYESIDSHNKPALYTYTPINTCDTFWPVEKVITDYLPLKIMANGNLDINGNAITDKLLLDLVDSTGNRMILLTYEPNVSFQQFINAYNHLYMLSRPYSVMELSNYMQNHEEPPELYFIIIPWFLSANACLE